MARLWSFLTSLRHRWLRAALLLLPLGMLAAAYAITLQTRINGSSDEYMVDVGEIQVALNTWGTIHHTGYPLFAILGNLFTPPLRTAGLEPAAAASLYAAAWGVIALGSFGLLLWRLTGRAGWAVLGAVVLGLTRSVWVHHVIAEVYSMSLAISLALLLVALWPAPWTGRWSVARRVGALALLGGIGVSHHRAVVFVAPGLLLAVWPHLWAARAQWRRLIPLMVGLALIGFVPYVYLPLRAWQGGAWVYGDPGNWHGFWIEFLGKEADRLVKLPADAAGWWDNLRSVWDILATELTLPGLLIGLAGLGLAVTVSPQRRAARTIAVSAAGSALFTVAYHTAVLPQAILMPVVAALVFGVVLALDWLARDRRGWVVGGMLGLLVWAGGLTATHYGWIHERVTDPTGLDTIARLEHIPRDTKPALMLPWGMRYFAASYSRLVTGENREVLMVDHKGDYRRILSDGYTLYTLPETLLYVFPPPWDTPQAPASEWWTVHLGPLYLTSAAPDIVRLNTTPWLADPADPPGEPIIYGITRRDAWLTCDATQVYLHVIWQANQRPAGDPSIFVHLTGDEAAPVLANADQRHPVYGLYPFVRWSPGEVVRDDFTLPRLPGATQVRLGLYDQPQPGQFVNYGEVALPLADCAMLP